MLKESHNTHRRRLRYLEADPQVEAKMSETLTLPNNRSTAINHDIIYDTIYGFQHATTNQNGIQE